MIISQCIQIILVVDLDVPHTSTKLADFTEPPREASAVGRERGVERGPGRDICYVF